tara:strand:+ start:299 stop:592 length:294 start_codon:yes stop_codon:yes gene_type:complete
MANIPKHFKTFIKDNNEFLYKLYNTNFKQEDINTHGLIYMKYIINDSNIDIAYITFNNLIDNKIIDKIIIDNIKKEYNLKKIIYINDDNNNYMLLLN